MTDELVEVDRQRHDLPPLLYYARRELLLCSRLGEADRPSFVWRYRHGVMGQFVSMPWDSAFVGYLATRCGFRATGAPCADSWLGWGQPIDPAAGAVTVYLERFHPAGPSQAVRVGINAGCRRDWIRVITVIEEHVVEKDTPMHLLVGSRSPTRFEHLGAQVLADPIGD